MARGDKVHKGAAAYIMARPDDTIRLPTEMVHHPYVAKIADELQAYSKETKVVEQQWGFNRSWRPTTWFGRDTWMRVVLDVGVVYPDATGEVIDWKTGKEYDDNADQRELNGLAMLLKYPHLSSVTSRMLYVDQGYDKLEEIHQEQRTDLIEKWEARVAPMFADTVFAARPGSQCHRCSFALSKNGPCKFG
jgi:hypothetical protein